MQHWIEEFSLTFERFMTISTQRLEVVVVGDRNCGKTELIQRFWDQHETYQHITGDTNDEYQMHLTLPNTDVCIFEAKTLDYVKETEFDDSVVFVLCYDVGNPESLDNLENVWLPAVKERADPYCLHFTVGIERDPIADKNSPAGIEREKQKNTMRSRAGELLRRTRGGFAINCCFANRDSLANVFQIAIDAVFPPIAVN